VLETANEVLSKKCTIRKPWVTTELLKLCDERRKLKISKYESDERADMYRKADKQVKTCMLKAKKDWINMKSEDPKDRYIASVWHKGRLYYQLQQRKLPVSRYLAYHICILILALYNVFSYCSKT
jgi:hypothetical protein